MILRGAYGIALRRSWEGGGEGGGMGFGGRLEEGGGREDEDEDEDCGGGLGGTPLPVVFLCWGGDGLRGGCGADEVFCAGAWAAAEGAADAMTGGGGAGAAGAECSGLLGEAGRGARWGGGAMEAEAVGSEDAEATGERCGACAGGGMDPVLALAPAPALALVLVLAGCPAVDGLEVDPAAEPLDTAVDGRDPELDGNASVAVLLATTMGVATFAAVPGNARLNDSRSRVDGLSLVSDGPLCGAVYDADGRAFTLPGCVKYEDSRSRAAATEASDIVAEDRLRMGLI